jgi:hypothetical protein
MNRWTELFSIPTDATISLNVKEFGSCATTSRTCRHRNVEGMMRRVGCLGFAMGLALRSDSDRGFGLARLVFLVDIAGEKP